MAICLAAPLDKQPTMILLVRSERTFIPPLAPLTREVKRVLLDTLTIRKVTGIGRKRHWRRLWNSARISGGHRK
jgi:hypothetical protein